MATSLHLVPGALTLDALLAIHAGGVQLKLDAACRPGIRASQQVVQSAADGDAPVYGVNTGFGKLANKRISKEQLATLQCNLIRSHCVGVGEPLSAPVMRLMLALKAASLARGYSGVRETVVDTLIAVFNAGLVPWVPSQGSIETIEWAADPSRRYPFLVTFSAREAVVRNLTAYRDQCRQFGYEADPGQLGWAAPVYVADTEEKAQNEARAAIEALFNDFLTLPPEMLLPPGYTSAQSLKKIIATKKAIGRGGFGPGNAPRQTLERLMELGTVLVGTPKTVLAQIEKVREQTQLGNFVAMLQFGTLNNELTRRNQAMFASEVMPHLQAL